MPNEAFYLQAYRIEPLIFEHYSHIPPVKINRAAKSTEKEFDDSPTKDTTAAGWIKSWFSQASKSPLSVAEYHSEGKGQVELPKGEFEKTEDVLKERKGEFLHFYVSFELRFLHPFVYICCRVLVFIRMVLLKF